MARYIDSADGGRFVQCFNLDALQLIDDVAFPRSRTPRPPVAHQGGLWSDEAKERKVEESSGMRNFSVRSYFDAASKGSKLHGRHGPMAR